MSGLRVAVDVTPLLGLRTGVYQCVEQLLRALPEAAPEVEVVPYVLSRRGQSRASELPAGTRFLAVPAAIAIRMWGFVDGPSVARSLDDVDVVHGTNFVVPPTGRPSSVTVHDAFCLAHPKECPPSVRPFDRVVRRAVRRGAWVHTSTSVLRRELVARYDVQRVKVVPFGIPPLGPSGALPTSVRTPYILSINTLEPRKRQEHLVRAFRSIADVDARVQLVIAGADGPASGAVENAIAALPVEMRPRVVRVPIVDDGARAALIRGATILAYPSADEGFGFPVLEAMAAGVPVVATHVGGIPEVAGSAAMLVPVEDDPHVLVDALRRLLDDDELRATMSRRGVARTEQFSWHAHAEGMAELWRTAAESA